MYTTHLRKVGGSVMMTVPPVLLEMLNLKAGHKVELTIDQGRLVVVPQPQPRYTLDELLAQCDRLADPSPEEREWLASPPVGSELL